ncbi:MAG: DUF4149 domain-containing protein [Gemmatimonadaceae bacterium]|nr:DUF4149 domain-containing protein [Gemmatimonadaceae bacterium]
MIAAANLLLAAWLGASVLFTAVVAPAAFRVLPARMLAGAVVGQVLPVIFLSGIVVALMALGLTARRPMRLRRWWQLGLACCLLGCGVAQFGIAPRIRALREQLPANLESVPPEDPRRATFGRLHGVSVAVLGAAMLGAALAPVVGLRSAPTGGKEIPT